MCTQNPVYASQNLKGLLVDACRIGPREPSLNRFLFHLILQHPDRKITNVFLKPGGTWIQTEPGRRAVQRLHRGTVKCWTQKRHVQLLFYYVSLSVAAATVKPLRGHHCMVYCLYLQNVFHVHLLAVKILKKYFLMSYCILNFVV